MAGTGCRCSRAVGRVSPRRYRSACQASQARSSCRVDEAGNPLRAQNARNSRSGSATRRRRSARRSGTTAAASGSRPAKRGRARPLGGDAVNDRPHPRQVDGHDGPVRPVGGRAQVHRRRVAAPVELPEPARALSQPVHLVRQAVGEVIATVQVSVLIAVGVFGRPASPAARSSSSAASSASSASRSASATIWYTREGDSPIAAARIRIETPLGAGRGQRPRPFPPGLLQPPRGMGDPRQHPPLPLPASIRSLIVTRPSCQPRSGNWTP